MPKSIVVVFGTQSLCARLGAPELWWGDSRLPTADTVKYLGLRHESSGGWAAEQAAGAANGWAALHRWLPVLRSRHLSAATKLLVLRSRFAPCTSYVMEQWRPSKRGANMTAVLVRAVKLISGIRRDASHTVFIMGRSVNQDVMLADLDVLSDDDHCRWHMPASMRGKQLPRPLLHCTRVWVWVLMVGCCCAEACKAAVLIGVMRLPGCPFGSAWSLVCEVCQLGRLG